MKKFVLAASILFSILLLSLITSLDVSLVSVPQAFAATQTAITLFTTDELKVREGKQVKFSGQITKFFDGMWTGIPYAKYKVVEEISGDVISSGTSSKDGIFEVTWNAKKYYGQDKREFRAIFSSGYGYESSQSNLLIFDVYSSDDLYTQQKSGCVGANVELDQTSYGKNDYLTVTIRAPDHNLSPTTKDVVLIVLSDETGERSVRKTLSETRTDSSIFSGSFPISEVIKTTPNTISVYFTNRCDNKLVDTTVDADVFEESPSTIDKPISGYGFTDPISRVTIEFVQLVQLDGTLIADVYCDEYAANFLSCEEGKFWSVVPVRKSIEINVSLKNEQTIKQDFVVAMQIYGLGFDYTEGYLDPEETIVYSIPYTTPDPEIVDATVLVWESIDNPGALSPPVSFQIPIGQPMPLHQELASSDTTTDSKTFEIPIWIRNNANWWAEDQIDDETFVGGIQFLIKEDILRIPTTQVTSTGTDEIPTWIKNNAGWWGEGLISDEDFINGIEYLVSNGIIRVS